MLFSGEQSLMLEDGQFALLLMCSFIQPTLSVFSERGPGSVRNLIVISSRQFHSSNDNCFPPFLESPRSKHQ